MRWSGQQLTDGGVGATDVLPGMRGLLRSVRTPEFAGTVFHEVEARSALNRVPTGSQMPFAWTVNPYRGCSHACVYCLAGPTRVRLADGGSRPIAELAVGDVVVGTEVRDGLRRYVATPVLAHWRTVKRAYRVRLSGGTELVASGAHKFLAAQGWRHVAGGWCASGRRPRLRAGSALLGPGCEPAEPRTQEAEYRRGYLCGLVRSDGEAEFPSAELELEALGRAHRFLAEESRSAVLARVGGHEPGRLVLPERGSIPAPHTVIRVPEAPADEWCAGFLAGVLDARGAAEGGALRIPHGSPETVGLVTGALHRLGFRFTVDQGAVRVAERRAVVAATNPAVGALGALAGEVVGGRPELVVEAVEALGVELAMFDITTGTGDFVAEGVVSHNCFARNTHTYLDLDPGADFDQQLVVKVNIARVLEREVRAPRWTREPVAMGTNTDPYQRAEGRYRLMPGVITALARWGTPVSVLTKGTVLTRDLPLLAAAAADVPVSLGVSIALLDRSVQAGLEPGTPSPAARLDLVRRITDAGLPCGVMVAPVLPLLTDSEEALDELLAKIAAAGARGATVLALHLRPGTREWFLKYLEREQPHLIEPYARLYRRGAYVDVQYRKALSARVAPLLARHGLAGGVGTIRTPRAPEQPAAPAEQLSLL